MEMTQIIAARPSLACRLHPLRPPRAREVPMAIRFAAFDAAEAVCRLAPARIFLRRREPTLRRVLTSLLPRDCYKLVEIGGATLLLREVSASVLAWSDDPDDAIELSFGARPGAAPGLRDVLVAVRHPAWNPGALLLTALSQDPDGNVTEYGSALVLGPGVSIALSTPGTTDLPVHPVPLAS